MVKQSILIIYKNGSSINLDVPENYYQNKYSKKSSIKLHKIFMKQYKKFVRALNKGLDIVDVNKYLPFSNASISGKDVISVDIKINEQNDQSKDPVNTFIPGLHDQVYLNLDGTQLENLLNKLAETNLVENLDKLIDKMISYFNKSNVEFTIKAGKKTTQPKKQKVVKLIDSEQEQPNQ